MSSFSITILIVSFLATLGNAIVPKCPIIHDGRVPSTTQLSTFDTTASPFNPDFVKGPDKFSKILSFPSVPPSRFDVPSGKPLEVKINQDSIFTPGGSAPQTGFRRASLIPAGNNGTDASTVGVVTFHWSVQVNAAKPLNTSHEYLLVWHERNDYAGTQFNFETGKLIGREALGEASDWKILDKKDQVLWTGKRVGGWQNFAITLDYEKNTIQVYHSIGEIPLVAVTKPLPNDNSDGGQFQVGILKKPTGAKDVVHDGYQTAIFEETLIYGGIFVEDSKAGCVSL